MKNKELALVVIALLALVAFALCGCAVDQSWKPQVGDDYRTVCGKLDAGTACRIVEGDEVRWWLSDPRTATHWVYYAKFDKQIVNVIVLTAGRKTTEQWSDAKLIEWAWEKRAYPEVRYGDPRW